MGKFWNAELRSAFLRNPVKITAMLAGYAIWTAMYAGLTLLLGGVLILTDKNDAWVEWWLP